jgi:hypothetical protein
MWQEWQLTPLIEVEGYPIKDRARFEAVREEIFEIGRQKKKMARQYQQTFMDDVKAGRVSKEQFQQRQAEILKTRQRVLIFWILIL